MPYGPAPRRASKTSTLPARGSSRPYTPRCPVNHSTPRLSNEAVLRLAAAYPSGSGKTRTSSVAGSTRTIALSPPSVIHGAPSGPTMTPCGADPGPRSTSLTSPVAGSRWPSVPTFWPVYQMPPSVAGATSCGWLPDGTANSTSSSADSAVLIGAPTVSTGVAAAVAEAVAEAVVDGGSVDEIVPSVADSVEPPQPRRDANRT